MHIRYTRTSEKVVKQANEQQKLTYLVAEISQINIQYYYAHTRS